VTSGGHVRRSIRSHLVAIAAAAILLVFGIGVIGATTELAGAVIASGALVVQSNVKKVQHPTGGIVGDLRVHDGARVQAGELVIRLDETTAQANLAMVEKSLAELFARRARLETERDGGEEIEFPEELLQAGRQAEIARVMAGERKLFELRRDAQRGQKAQLRERISQLIDEVRGYTDQAAAKVKEIEFIQKELEGVRDLWQKNLVPISRVTALERGGERARGHSREDRRTGRTQDHGDRRVAADRHPRSAIGRGAPACGPYQGRRGLGRRADHAHRAGG
jgi:membrane fusion protein, type I secretion system